MNLESVDPRLKLAGAVIALICVVAIIGLVAYLIWPILLMAVGLVIFLMACIVMFHVSRWSIETISDNWDNRGR